MGRPGCLPVGWWRPLLVVSLVVEISPDSKPAGARCHLETQPYFEIPTQHLFLCEEVMKKEMLPVKRTPQHGFRVQPSLPHLLLATPCV